jgi:hypothetical protein
MMNIHLRATPIRGADGRYQTTYQITDPITGDYYIGKHSTRRIPNNYRGSGNWVKQHPARFRLVMEYLAFHPNEEAAYMAEAALVDLTDKRCPPSSL